MFTITPRLKEVKNENLLTDTIILTPKVSNLPIFRAATINIKILNIKYHWQE
jgi:hypothetical protein